MKKNSKSIVKNSPKKHNYITIKCTEQQALILEHCLETMSRCTSGQLRCLTDGMSFLRGKEFVGCQDERWSSLGGKVERMIKPELFPELHENASYGVGMKELGRNAQIAYEMYKKLQNYRTIGKKDVGVLAHEPLHYSKEPLIEVTEWGRA